MNNLIFKINSSLGKAETRTGLVIFSLLIGIVFSGFAMLYVSPRFQVAYNGIGYAEMSVNPFDFTGQNPLRFRILAPLIGYLVGLRGKFFFILPLIFAVLFLSVIYLRYRKKIFSPLDSILVLSLITFSCVFLIQLQAPGYTDVIYYFFLFLAFSFIKKPGLSALFFCLGLLTHECLLLMFPGLIIYYWYLNPLELKPLIKYVIFLMIATVPMFLFREWMSSHITVAYDMKFYISQENIQLTLSKVLPRIPLGLFFVFKVFWFLPLWMGFNAFQKKDYRLLLFVFVMIICDLAQVVVAYDVTRMLCLIFPLLLVSAEELRKEFSEKKFVLIMSILIFANFLVPQYFMSADGPVPMPCVFPFLQTF